MNACSVKISMCAFLIGYFFPDACGRWSLLVKRLVLFIILKVNIITLQVNQYCIYSVLTTVPYCTGQ